MLVFYHKGIVNTRTGREGDRYGKGNRPHHVGMEVARKARNGFAKESAVLKPRPLRVPLAFSYRHPDVPT